jgi:hypothetical protein
MAKKIEVTSDPFANFDFPSERQINAETKSTKMRIISRHRYGKGTYIVRSPGCDLLDFYDNEWLSYKNGKSKQATLPPSIIYRIRHAEQYAPRTRHSRIVEILEQEGYGDVVKNSATCFTKDVFNSMYKWLPTTPHESWEFREQTEAYNFVKELFPNKFKGKRLNQQIQPYSKINPITTHMWWMSQPAGWSIIYVED